MKFKSDIEVQAGLKDSSGAAGTSGQVLSSNGTTVSWINSGGGFANDVQNTVKAGVAINKGQAVYVTGADGTNIIVGLASNATEATSSKTLGLLNATVAINGFADVIQIGKLAGLDTSTAVVGDPVWLGSNGNLIYGLANKPYAPLHLVYIGVVTRVNANNGEIFINVQNGFELKEIHDVDIVSTPPSNNEILAFEGGSVNLWKNKSISSIGGITGTGTSGQVAFWNGTSSVTGSSNFTFSNDRLTINRTSDSRIFLQENGVTNLQLQAISGLSRLSSNNGNLALATAGGDRLLVFLNGNIGVNTTTDAGYKLDVNGTARVQGSINIGSSLSTISYNLPLSITLPAIGTKVAFLNVGINSVIKVELNGSENGFYQPMLLTISRNNTGASITINKDNPFFHENSNDISFSFDTATGDIYAEKIVYSTGRNFRISKVEVLFGTATVLNGTLTSTTNVGVDQTVTRIGKALYVTGANTAAQGNLTVAQGNVLIGTATASAFRLDVLGTTRLNGLQTFQGTTASDTAPLGSELAAVTGTGTGWTLAGTNLNVGGYTHTTGDVTSLTTTLAAVSGTYYQIAYTITGRTTGSITINYGGTATSGITSTGATGPLASSTSALTITPTTDFNGTVVLSIKTIGTSSATTTFLNSSGTAATELRASNTTSNSFIGLFAGRRNTSGGSNTFLGTEAGVVNTTGSSNTFLGRRAGFSNTSGGSNTSVGALSLSTNTVGNSNTAIGQGTLNVNTTGSSNTAIGTSSLLSNTIGTGNSAIGISSLQANTTGNSNTSFGQLSLNNNTTGSNNVALGVNSGRYAGAGTTAMTAVSNSIYLGALTRGLNATGSTNEIVIGYDVVGLGSNTTVLGNSSTTATAIYGDLLLGGTTDNGTDKLQVTGSASISADSAINGVNIGRGGGAITTNTRVGTIALNSNTTGSGNSAFGISALNANTTGGSNTAIGRAALEANTTGTTNTAVGTFSLLSNISGSNNVSLGFNSGRFIADGTTANTISNTSIFIGVSTKALADNQTNQIVIGHNAVGLGSNTTVLGNSSTTTTAIYGNLLLGSTTDAGYKLDVNGTGRFSGILRISTGVPALQLFNTTNGDNWATVQAEASTGTGGQLAIYTKRNGNTETVKIRVTENGNTLFYPNLPIVMSGQGAAYYGSNITLASDIGSTQGANRIWSRYDGTGRACMSFETATNAQSYNSDPTSLTYTEYMRITGLGNVGIGTTSPSSKLHVLGKGIFDIGSSSGDVLVVDKLSGGNIAFNINGVYSGQIGAVGSGDLYIASKSTYPAIVVKDGGNVGIGTTSPNQLLSISSSAVGGSTFGLYNTASNTDNRNWALKLNANNYGDLGFFVSSSNGGNPESGSIPMLINKSGNVGIGTTSPSVKLQVEGNSIINGVSGDDTLYLQKPTGATLAISGATGTTNKILIGGSNATNPDMFVYVGGSERMRITSGGNVGIGTTSPLQKLHVEGLSYFGSDIFTYANGGIFFNGNNNYASGIYQNASGLNLQLGSTPKIFIANGGSVGIGTTSPVNPLTVQSNGSAQGIAILNRSGDDFSNLNFYNYAGTSALGGIGNSSGRIRIMSGGVGDAYERLSITSGGNVGIGTTTDAGYKLDVNGTGRFNTSLTVGAGGLAGRLSVRGTTNDSSAYSFESANSSGNSLFLVRNDGVATIANLAGTGTRLVTANASGVLSTTAGDAAPRYSSYVIVSHSSYTNICTINGDALASAIKMSFQGTSGNVVVNTTAEILVNHHQDISITSNSGFYSQLNIRIISNNNESYSVEAQVIGATTPTGLNIEVFPLNSEAVTFQGTLVTPGTTLIHTTRPGMYISATGGNQGDISASGSVYAGETMVSNGNATFGNTANRRVNYDSNGGNFRIKANAGGWAMGYFFDGSSGTYRGGYGGFGNADGLTYYWVGSDYNIPTMVVQPNQGNVMIGTTTDAGYKLDVAGTGRVTGSLTINSATTPFLHFHSTRTSGQSGYIKDDGNMVFQKTESGGGFRFLNSSSSVLLSIDAVGASAFSNNVTITPPSNQVALRVNHSGTNGAEGSKFNSAGSGTTYGSMTMLVDSCNYGTGIRIVTGLWSASQSAMQFYSGTTSVGSISCTTSATAYNTSSDYRLKENVVPMESSINRLKELNPCRFNFINNPDKTVDGFIAHEVQEVIPEAITGEKDELDYDGSPKYQGIDQSKIVPLLTAALQEAISKIEELENRLLILENK